MTLTEATSLASACEQAGLTFIGGDGACLAHGFTSSVSFISPADQSTACPDGPPLNGASPVDAADVAFAGMTVQAVELASNREVIYDVGATIRAQECSARLYFNLGWTDALPRFSIDESFRFREDSRQYENENHDTPGYTEVRSASNELLWLSFSGRFGLHGNDGPPDASLELIQDPGPTCYDDVNSESALFYGMTFRTANGECHVEPASANCCNLWGQPYVVQLDRFRKDGVLNYLIVKSDFLVGAADF